MRFGERVRQLRLGRNLTQQKLADLLGVSLSYVNKVENERLSAGNYPSEVFVYKLASGLGTDEDELLMLTDRVPLAIRQRALQCPKEFMFLASLDDISLEKAIQSVRDEI